MVKSEIEGIILQEYNKRIEDKKRIMQEQDDKIKQKINQYDKLIDNMQKVGELNKNMEKQTEELNSKLDTILEKENQMFRPDYIVRLEDGELELVRKEDVEIVNDENVIKNVKELD